MILSTIPYDNGIKEVYCDIVELNHVYNGYGESWYDQVILWHFRGEVLVVDDYANLPGRPQHFSFEEKKAYKEKHKIPLNDPFVWPIGLSPRGTTGKYYIFFRKKFTNNIYLIKFNTWQETWTQHDAESDNREILQYENRRRSLER